MKIISPALLVGLALAGSSVLLPAIAKPLVDCINPLVGASTSTEYGEGKTFPGAATPFGLVQLSPDTITGGDDGPGYSYEHTTIEGFSFTHMSGIGWYGDLENFLVMPTTGKLHTERGVNGNGDGYRSRFNHDNHANEPVHHTAYLFAYVGKPWLTQKWARTIMDHAYGAGVKGLCGNEGVGQMSAWYILSATGFHPVLPVDGIYIIGSPLFDEVTIKLDSHFYPGKTFTVKTRNNSAQNIYVQSATLNGKPLNRAWLSHQGVVAGGTLELVMGPTPNESWGSAANQLPPRNFPSLH